MAVVRIPANNWFPRPHQRKLWNYLEGGGRRAVEIAHRRWGKDEIALHWSAVASFERVGGTWHCLPLFSQARKAIWTAVNPHTGKRRIDEAFPQELRDNTNDQEMFIRFKNGSTWQVIGSDTYDRLVGASVAGIVFSEWALANPAAWSYLSPIVAENNGWAMFITTPRGRNHAKTIYDSAKADPHWFAEISSVEDSKSLPQAILDEMRADYISLHGEDAGDALYSQELLCSFEAAILGSYYGKEMVKAEKEGRICFGDKARQLLEPDVPVHTSWDLGVAAGNTMNIWFWQAIGPEIRVVDHHGAHGYAIDHYAGLIKKRAKDRGYKLGTDFVPHDAKVREMTSSGKDGKAKQRIEVMLECGMKPKLVADHKVEDGISAVRQILPRCWFDGDRCEAGLEGLRQYQAEWDEDLRVFKKIPLPNFAAHPADSFRYLAMAYRETKPAPAKPLDRILSVGSGNQVTLNDLWKLQPKKSKRI